MPSCLVHLTTVPFYRSHDLESQGLYSSPVHYYDFLQNRVMIFFKPKFEDLDKEEFELILSKKMNYEMV
jgi:ubiquitin carboxyl-terminal hydrolase 7